MIVSFVRGLIIAVLHCGFFTSLTNSQCTAHHKHLGATKETLSPCELHRALLISDNFECEVDQIRKRYLKAGFPHAFINDVINNFRFSRLDRLIPENFFDENAKKPFFRIRLPFCQKNERLSRYFCVNYILSSVTRITFP